MTTLNFGSEKDWIESANQIIRASIIVLLGSGFAGAIDSIISVLAMEKIIPVSYALGYYKFALSIMLTAIFTAFVAYLARDFIEGYYKAKKEDEKQTKKKKVRKKMKYRELWKFPAGKFLYIWLIGTIIYAIYSLVIEDIVHKLTLSFYGIAFAPLPIWIVVGHRLKKGLFNLKT